jgi:hypothetical protein
MYVSKNGRIEAFDCFVPQFPQELLTGCSVRAIGTLFAKCGGEMFYCTILKSRVPLFRIIVWCWGSLLKALVLSLPSLAKVGPIGGGVRCVKAENTRPMGVSPSVFANTFALKSSHMIEVFIELPWIIAIRPVLYRHFSRLFRNVVVLSIESTMDLITTTIVVESLVIISIALIAIAFVITTLKVIS